MFPWGRVDRYDEANSRFSQLREGAYKRLGYRVHYEITILSSSVVGPVAQSVQRLTTAWTVGDRILVGTRFSASPDRP